MVVWASTTISQLTDQRFCQKKNKELNQDISKTNVRIKQGTLKNVTELNY